ncbi:MULTISPECIES: DEAD/DEAH box helicase [Clostridia]|uniref:DEAD/DEAH box helicase n=1 Tax=Clostridia TaxID=186801 RepID=UPI000EA3B041|nr:MULTISPECIES: DEAD/DEAH box helicase [Clostridia]NBJ69592.1 DNA/RNA helicase [Roseburia sp. 1XD42-34]RKI78347.1 DNA/RNA helicase [Clostridium sp. 1xD42-85]
MAKKTSPLDPKLAQQLEGKLLLRKEIPFEDTLFDFLLEKNMLTPIPSIVKTLFRKICQRCGNRTNSRFAKIHDINRKHGAWYCRNCLMMGRIIETEPLYRWNGQPFSWQKHEAACTWKGQLTKAQAKASEMVRRFILQPESSLLVWAVCGSGKTEMLFSGIEEALRQGMRICIATPRIDVVRELLPRIQQAFSAVPIQALYGDSAEKQGTSQIIIASTHQLLRFEHAFDVIIIDEIDAFPYHKDASLAFATERALKPSGTMIYLTATPRQKQRTKMLLKQLKHVFVPTRYHGYPLPVPIMCMCFALQKNLVKGNPPRAFIQWLRLRQNQQRQLLIFLPTIALTEKIASNLSELLIHEHVIKGSAEISSVHASDPDREQKISLFREKNLFVLVTTTILERGVTFPAVDVAIIHAGHSVFDEAALVQIAGRAGRSADDPTGEVVFFHDGKTNAMSRAVRSIKKMNRIGRWL